MPRSSCDSCCNPEELARSNPMFKAALLAIMCAILAVFEAWQAIYHQPPGDGQQGEDPPGGGDEN